MDIYDVLHCEWKWYWRKNGDNADCGIFAELRRGHGYSVCRCPRYLTEKEWREYATHICDVHNATLTATSAKGQPVT